MRLNSKRSLTLISCSPIRPPKRPRLWAASALACAALSCVLGANPAPAAAPGCVDFSFPVYFRPGSAQFAPGAKTAIAAAARHYRRCALASITIVGLSIPKGGRELMERRLHAVSEELARRGLRRPRPMIAGAVIARQRPMIANSADVEIAVR